MIRRYVLEGYDIAVNTAYVAYVKIPTDDDGKCYAFLSCGKFLNLSKEQATDLAKAMEENQ